MGENESNTELEKMKAFDEFVRKTILEEGNKLRAEKGYPPVTEEELDQVDPEQNMD